MTLTNNAPRFLSVDLDEWGSLLLAECRHPESSGEEWDLGLGLMCPVHTRTVYYCADNGVLWCDGYVGGDLLNGEYNPHELDVAVGDPLPRLNADAPDVDAPRPPSVDDPALREAFIAEFEALVRDPSTVELVSTRYRAWCLLAAVQLASRHPHAAASPVLKTAIQAARRLERLCATTPALKTVAAAGWDQTVDA